MILNNHKLMLVLEIPKELYILYSNASVSPRTNLYISKAPTIFAYLKKAKYFTNDIIDKIKSEYIIKC
jgi:hypothetical protein